MKAVRLCCYMLAVFAIFLAAGCGRRDNRDGVYEVYYLNKESTKIVPVPYEPADDPDSVQKDIKGLLERLSEDPGEADYKQAIPDGVKVLDCVLEETLLTLYFNEEYGSIDRIVEPLVRAAIVRTMTQVEGVECLTFFVGDKPLADNDKNPIGVMTDDSFVENPGEQINSIQSATLTLYFSNQEGNGLVAETQDIHYSSNISMEKLVMERLLLGPKGADAKSAIPEGTKLISVSVSDGVCFVSLDETFRNQDYNIEEPIVLYSIINSLSELSTVNKVQVSVGGDTSGVYRDKFALDELYERNLDYVLEE
ncbi:MAG: GerMN domain-containing protein [Eubacterium sp.]|jgi:germination protein M|nr:GerMN domain-containing protein [Eubacterium sp.]